MQCSMKQCQRCGVAKSLGDFYRHPGMADGHLNSCKTCRNAYVKGWSEQNAERRKAIARDYGRRAYTSAKAAASWAKWYVAAYADPAKRARIQHRGAKRRAAEAKATPAWANEFFIEQAYEIAQKRSEVTGTAWEVDHMVPLQSALVCGLHVEHNLRVIPSWLNRSKRNFYWPDGPQTIAGGLN